MKGEVYYQLVHTLSYGDAISTEVLSLDRLFKKWGVRSKILALNVHPRLKKEAVELKDLSVFPIEEHDAAVILHYSLGSPLNDIFRALTPGHKKFIIYHNLTPAHWFENVNPRVAEDIEQGAKELPELCRIADVCIADSHYNAGELKPFGVDPKVLPLTFDPVRWSVGENSGISALLSGDPATHLLHVGRTVPNKTLEDVIKVFYFYHHHIDKNSRLWLAGIDIDTEIYSFSLKQLVHEFHLDDAVKFVGGVSDEELRSFYTHCDGYLCMSEHEGFCLPVVEAMYFELPVFAFASTALPETVRDGGVLFSEKRHAEIAEMIATCLKDPAAKSALKGAGKRRAASFTAEVFESNARTIFGS